MKITAILVASLGAETEASVSGEVLTVNGVEYDLSAVPEGGEARPTGDHPFVGPIRRKDGELCLSVIWYYRTNTAEPSQGTEHPIMIVTSGAVSDPVKRKVMEEPA